MILLDRNKEPIAHVQIKSARIVYIDYGRKEAFVMARFNHHPFLAGAIGIMTFDVLKTIEVSKLETN